MFICFYIIDNKQNLKVDFFPEGGSFLENVSSVVGFKTVDNEGKPITVSLKDHTKEIIKNHYASLDDFLNKWNHTEKKAAIVKELEEQGVLVAALQDAVNKELDLFDLVCNC